MPADYKSPRQSRALVTEQRFLGALNDLLQHKSLGQLTIDEIAQKAGLTRSAFLKRFGTKKQALLLLYGRYCEKVVTSMAAIHRDLSSCADSVAACRRMSIEAEMLQTVDFSANRAMHELFMEDLTVAPQTKALFLHCVELIRAIQKTHLPPGVGTEVGAFAAAQLVFTINYNHVLKAMPGLPRDPDTRHQLIANLVAHALQF